MCFGCSVGVRLCWLGSRPIANIGPGRICRHDSIFTHSIFKLSTNHRQVTHRGITSLAAHILNRQPVTSPLGHDLTMISVDTDNELQQLITDVFLRRAMDEHGVGLDDIQLIIPIHKGPFGIANMNQTMAQLIRLPAFKHHPWVVGDRVIQCRNNYTTG